MPRTSKAEAPVVVENEVLTSRHVELDEFTVVFESYHVDADGAPVFKGLPDDRCQCPHWGYVVKGRLRVRYEDHVETLRAGDAYYMAPGHLPIFDEDTEVVEFSPRGEYQKTMDVAARNVAALAGV